MITFYWFILVYIVLLPRKKENGMLNICSVSQGGYKAQSGLLLLRVVVVTKHAQRA